MDGGIPPEAILVVEDEGVVRSLVLRKLAQSGYVACGAADGLEALHLLRERSFSVILSDISMPNLDGLSFLQIVRETYPETTVVMLTAHGDLDHAVTAMKLGAADYLVKPLGLSDLISVVQQAILHRRNALKRKQAEVEWKRQLQRQKNPSQRLLLSTVMALANTLEAKDPYTVGHSQRVADLATALAEKIGLPDDEIGHVRRAGLLHDIGKIGIREAVINKPGPLTSEEYAHIQTHPLISERILQPVYELNGSLSMIRHHHERWDGTGYPDGLSGLQIPLGSRLLALADAYDAMTSERPYRPALPIETAIREIGAKSGQHFDPQFSQLFIEVIQEAATSSPHSTHEQPSRAVPALDTK